MDSEPMSVNDDQRLADQERYRQKMKDGLGLGVEGR
jgi:hypothetical protein